MNKIKIIIILMAVLTCTVSLAAESVTITAGVPITWDRLKNYKAVTQEKSCADITSYDLPGASRGLAEMLFICKALHLGGVNPVFKFKRINTYARLLKQVSNGDVLLMMESAWMRDADPNKVFISDPVLKTGEFEVGVFTRPQNTELLKVRSVEELRKFKAVTNKNWVVDWETLIAMGIEKTNVPMYPMMFKLVKSGRVDFMLEAFSSKPDLSQENGGIRLVPVPNIKVGLKGSRHILVNRNMPNSQKVFDALQIGLRKLYSAGEIARAYEESGFIHTEVKSWKLLCCVAE